MKKKVKEVIPAVDVFDSKIMQIEVGDIELDPLHPYFSSPVSEARKEPLKEIIKLQTSADAVKVYKTVKDGKDVYIALDNYEFVQMAFLCFVAKIWCQVITGITLVEAYLLMARLQGENDHWTTFDQAVHYNNGYDLLGDDIDGAMARYAREAGCSRANVTHLYHIGLVAKFLKSKISADKYSLLRTRGTHLRYMYPVSQHWVKLCVDMLAGNWSAERVKETVKKLLLLKPDAESSPDEESVYKPEPEPDKPQPSQLDILSGLHTDIDKIQLSLVQVADVLRHDWAITSPEDQESAQAIAKEIHDIITNILNYFPLSWLVANNEESVNTEATVATGAVQIPLI